MRVNPLQPKLPDLPVRPVAEMGFKELERIRLILRGGSVIEWRRLHFGTATRSTGSCGSVGWT